MDCRGRATGGRAWRRGSGVSRLRTFYCELLRALIALALRDRLPIRRPLEVDDDAPAEEHICRVDHLRRPRGAIRDEHDAARGAVPGLHVHRLERVRTRAVRRRTIG